MSEGEAAAAPADGGQATQQAEGGSDFDAAQAFGELRSSQEAQQQILQQMHERFEQAPWSQQDEQADEGSEQPGLDLSLYGDPDLDREANERMAAAVNQLAQQSAEQIIEQRLAPMQEALQEERYHREAADLVAEFPELGDSDMQDKLFNPQSGAAVQLAQHAGHPELAREPWFWRQSYLALKGMEAAQAEQGADAPAAAHLEGGAGANPGGGQVDLGDLIVGGGGDDRPLGGRVLDFG